MVIIQDVRLVDCILSTYFTLFDSTNRKKRTMVISVMSYIMYIVIPDLHAGWDVNILLPYSTLNSPPKLKKSEDGFSHYITSIHKSRRWEYILKVRRL